MTVLDLAYFTLSISAKINQFARHFHLKRSHITIFVPCCEFIRDSCLLLDGYHYSSFQAISQQKKKQISLFDRSVGTTRDKVKGHNVHVYCPINSGYFATNKKGVGVEKGR